MPVDPIEPDQPLRAPYPVAQNPFLYELLATRTATPTPTANSTTTTVDEQRLATDGEYLTKTLDYILWRARGYFQEGFYKAADDQYALFFRYLLFYGNRFAGIQDNFYFALFERGWVLGIMGKQQQADEFLNQQLMLKLEWVITHPPQHPTHNSQSVAKIVQSMVGMGQLPTSKNLSHPIPLRNLTSLMQQLINTGNSDLARHVLGHIEVRQLLSLFQTEYEAQRLFPAGERQSMLSPMLQALMAQQAIAQRGVPMVPVLPLMSGERERLHPNHELADIDHVYTDLVEPVYGLGKDPNEAVHRQRREEQLRKSKARNKKIQPVQKKNPDQQQ